MRGGEIHFFGARKPEIEHLDPLRHQPFGNGRWKRLGRGTDYRPSTTRRAPQSGGKVSTDGTGDIFVQLRAEAAANIIGFETGKFRHVSY